MTYLLASVLAAALGVVAALTGVLIWQLQRGGRAADKLLALTEARVELQTEHDNAVAAADETDKQNKRLRNALNTAEEMVADCSDVDDLPDLLDRLRILREDMSETANPSGNGGEAVHEPAAGLA